MSSLTTDGTGSLNLPLTLDGLNSLDSTISDSALLVDGSNKMNASLNLGSNRLINVASGIAGSDGVNVTQLSSYLPLTGTTSALNMNNKKITNTAVGTVSTDVATLQNVSNSIAGINTFLRLDGSSVMAADMDLGNHWVWGSPTGTPPDPSNLISLQFSQDQLNAALSTVLSKSGGTMNGEIAMSNNKIRGLSNGVLSTDAATVGQISTATAACLALSGGTLSGGLSMGNNSITNLAPAVNNTDAASWIDVKNRTALYLPMTGGTVYGGLAITGIINATGSISIFQALSATSATLTGPINMNTSRITNLGDAAAATDAAAYGQVTSAVATCLPLSGGTITGSVAMSGNKITGLQNGTLSTDAAAYGQIATAMAAYFPLAGGIITGNLQVNGTVNTSNININGNWVQGCNLGTPPTQDTLVSKQYFDTAVNAKVGSYLPLSGGTLTGALALGSNKVTGLANGTVSSDAAAFGQIASATANYLPLSGGVLTGNTTCNTFLTLKNPILFNFASAFSAYNGSTSYQGGYAFTSFSNVTVGTSNTDLSTIANVQTGLYLVFATMTCNGFNSAASSSFQSPGFTSTNAGYFIPTYQFPNSSNVSGITLCGVYMPTSGINSLTFHTTTAAGSLKAEGNILLVRLA